MSERTLSVPEISCATCKDAIEAALAPLPGVVQAVVNVPAKQVWVRFDESRIGLAQLVEAIQARGFEVEHDR